MLYTLLGGCVMLFFVIVYVNERRYDKTRKREERERARTSAVYNRSYAHSSQAEHSSSGHSGLIVENIPMTFDVGDSSCDVGSFDSGDCGSSDSSSSDCGGGDCGGGD